MRWLRAFAIAIFAAFLLVTSAAPAISATRLRVYRGETSDGHRIAFRVERTDQGRFIREFRIDVTFSCEDQTTQEWGLLWGFARNSVPITEGAFSFDEVDPFLAIHLAGELGKLQGSGAASLATAALSEDEDAVLCTTGDLTWTVEYVRTITRPRF
jgi:hypothetical protein